MSSGERKPLLRPHILPSLELPDASSAKSAGATITTVVQYCSALVLGLELDQSTVEDVRVPRQSRNRPCHKVVDAIIDSLFSMMKYCLGLRRTPTGMVRVLTAVIKVTSQWLIAADVRWRRSQKELELLFVTASVIRTGFCVKRILGASKRASQRFIERTVHRLAVEALQLATYTWASTV